MKGIVFNLLEEVVRREHGEHTWDQLLDRAGVDGIYTSLGSYPDADMMKLVGAASAALGVSTDDVLRWFGRAIMPDFVKRFPEFFAAHRDTRSFLLTLNDVIHPEVRKILPGAEVPEFDYDTSSEAELLMGYTSSRRLCAFGEGLINGSADFYGEKAKIDQPRCTQRGDDKCVFRVSLSRQTL